MKKLFFIILITCFSVPLFAKIKVATPIFPLYDIVKNIGSNEVSVVILIKPGENPHHFEPGIKTIKKVKDAAVYFGIDKRFDGWVEKIVSKKKVMFLNDFIKADNPHIWLSFDYLSKIADEVTNKLCELNPKKCDYFKNNKKVYIAKFEKLRKRYDFHDTFVVECHPAWTKFLNEVGIRSIGYIKRGKEREPSLKTLRTLLRRAKLLRVKYLVCSSNDRDKIHDKVAKLLNVKKIVLEPLGGFPPYASLFDVYQESLKILDNYLDGR